VRVERFAGVYFSAFDCIEIQSTFYGPPSVGVATKWRNAAPPGFQFCIKAWQLITHTGSSKVRADATARVFEAATGREVLRLGHGGSVEALAFSADGKLLATGSGDHTARVFEAATGREMSRLAHRDAVHAVAFSADGKLVATGSWDQTARVFEAATGREVSRRASVQCGCRGLQRRRQAGGDGV
jgi:WD40 repeat protein